MFVSEQRHSNKPNGNKVNKTIRLKVWRVREWRWVVKMV